MVATPNMSRSILLTVAIIQKTITSRDEDILPRVFLPNKTEPFVTDVKL